MRALFLTLLFACSPTLASPRLDGGSDASNDVASSDARNDVPNDAANDVPNVDGGEELLNEVAPDQVIQALARRLGPSTDPGGVIAVSIGDEIVVEAPAGTLEVGGAPVTLDAHFQAGSVTKMFTAALILALVEDGTLTLNDPINTWSDLVELASPHDASSQTLDLLLSHRSGHANAAPEDLLFSLPCEAGREGSQATMRRLNPQSLEFAPATLWSYSNHGFNVAGFIAQEAAGVYFAELMRQKIFAPLRMTTASFDESSASLRALGHVDGAPLDFPPEPPCGYFDPSGAVTSLRIHDLILFGQMLASGGGDVLAPESFETMVTPRSPAYGIEYGYGVFLRTLHGASAVGHPGSTYGYAAHLETVPEHRLAVAVMVNGDRVDPSAIAEEVLALYLSP